MGRYYSGDIEGKFWFGVQSSDDASFFGGTESEPNWINYYFDKDDLSDIKKGIQQCEEELGENLGKLDTFYKKHIVYNDETLSKETGIEKGTLAFLLEWYARLELGRKILTYVQENGDCSFEAEL